MRNLESILLILIKNPNLYLSIEHTLIIDDY